jgi:gliding motility-associated-like protein
VISVDYTVYNPNATAVLHAGTPIAIYSNGVFIQTLYTQGPIAINGSESGTVSLVIPDQTASPFELKFVVDDDGTGHGIVLEVDENNNTSTQIVELAISKPIGTLNNLVSCNEGLGKGTFDFSGYENSIMQNPTDVVTFYPTLSDLQNGTNAITNASNYTATTTPASIFVKVDNGNCYNTTSFLLTTRICPPTVYNYVSVNNDTFNSSFFIDGLRDIFLQFQLSVYNRWGKLVWTGNNSTPNWDGYANKGAVITHTVVPEGTYYYVLELHDKDYPQPLVGYLYLTH